jgi:hypothetical protein
MTAGAEIRDEAFLGNAVKSLALTHGAHGFIFGVAAVAVRARQSRLMMNVASEEFGRIRQPGVVQRGVAVDTGAGIRRGRAQRADQDQECGKRSFHSYRKASNERTIM